MSSLTQDKILSILKEQKNPLSKGVLYILFHIFFLGESIRQETFYALLNELERDNFITIVNDEVRITPLGKSVQKKLSGFGKPSSWYE
jgi:hypothetical protein